MKLLLVVLAMPLASFAQDRSPWENTLLGVAVRARPAYDGSASRVVDLIPVVRYYGDALFARTTQGVGEAGARYYFTPDLAIGAQLAYEAGRHKSESSFLRDHDVPDVSDNASVGAHIEWDTKLGPAPLNILGRYRQNADSDRGAQADLRTTLGVYGEHGLRAGLFVQATWANAKSMRTYYDVSGSGLLFLATGVEAGYDLARHWLLVASVEGRRMQGDAADSPLVEKKSTWYARAGIAYRF